MSPLCGPGVAALTTLVVGMTYGAIATLALNVCCPMYLSLGWLLLASPGARLWCRDSRFAGRIAVIFALAWAATMAGVALVDLAGPDRGGSMGPHPAWGEHPVLVLAGAPWPGIEGNGRGAAMDRVPFAMGIDAMLVNLTAFGVVIASLLWRSQYVRRGGVLTAAAVAAAGFGRWRLVVLFD